MCTLRHILPQGAMNTFNKATEEGELKWVNLLDDMHTNCACICESLCVTHAPAIEWSGSKSRVQGRVLFSFSMNL